MTIAGALHHGRQQNMLYCRGYCTVTAETLWLEGESRCADHAHMEKFLGRRQTVVRKTLIQRFIGFSRIPLRRAATRFEIFFFWLVGHRTSATLSATYQKWPFSSGSFNKATCRSLPINSDTTIPTANVCMSRCHRSRPVEATIHRLTMRILWSIWRIFRHPEMTPTNAIPL